jgi:hypothetical protein
MSEIDEEFPTLPTKKTEARTRSPSAVSSESSAYVGLEECKTILAKGEYATFAVANVRRFVKCYCVDCVTDSGRAKVPRQEEWCKTCEKSTIAKRGTRCEVTNSMVIGRGKKKFSIAYVTYETSVKRRGRKVKQTISGWVLSKHLKRVFSTSKSVAQSHVGSEEYYCSRSPSMMSSYALEPLFRFNDLVLVRGNDDVWVRGEVRQEEPLLILVEGATEPQRFHLRDIKTPTTREFVTVKELAVRNEKFVSGWGVSTLRAGTTVRVAYMEGFEGRIVAPVQGWISMREAHCVNVVESGFTYSQQNPTVFVKNLPATITEQELKTILVFRGYVSPMSITFQRKGDAFRAVVVLRSSKCGAALVNQKHLELKSGEQIEISWDMGYLKNVAAWRLGRLQNRI